MTIALLAALTMVVTDILGTIMVQAEAANRGWLAGLMDAAGWIVSIITTTISVATLSGHNFSEKVWVVALVTAANILGTKLGQVMGQKLMGRTGKKSVEQRVTELEQIVQELRATHE